MKIFNLFYILMGGLVCFSACIDKKASHKNKKNDNFLIEKVITTPLGEYQTYHNGHQGYSIQIPKGWFYKVKKNTVLVIQSPKQNAADYVESLDVVIVDAGFQQKTDGTIIKNAMELSEFYQNHIGNLAKSTFNLLILEEGEKQLAGNRVKWAAFKPNDSRKDLIIVKHFVASAHQVFILTANLKEETFPTLGPVFNEVAESFRVLSDNR